MILNLRIWENLQADDPNRFYPSDVPVFDYEPLRSHFQIVKSPEAINEGIISLISLKVEEIAFKWTGWFLTKQTLHSLQHKEGVYIHDPHFSGKLLHSCLPNLFLNVKNLTAYVIRPIKPFDRLTCNYNDSEDILYNAFQCTCGAENCIVWVEGKGKR